jgi:hypothetical protein
LQPKNNSKKGEEETLMFKLNLLLSIFVGMAEMMVGGQTSAYGLSLDVHILGE